MINNEILVIRVLEEPFAEDLIYINSDRRLSKSDDSSSEESEFIEETMSIFENVPETIFSLLHTNDRDVDGFESIGNSKFESVEHFEEVVMGRARELLGWKEKKGTYITKVALSG